MRFHLIRNAFVGSIAALTAFVATNAAGVASANQNPAKCTKNWIKMAYGGEMKVCGALIGKNTITGQVIFKSNFHPLKYKEMAITISDPSLGRGFGYKAGATSTVARNLPPGTYHVSFFQAQGFEEDMSPDVTVGK